MDYSRFLLESRSTDEPYYTRKLGERSLLLPGLVSFAAGMPNMSLVPIEEVSIKLKDGHTVTLDNNEIRKLSTYQPCKGTSRSLAWITRLHKEFHDPPIMDHPNPDVRFSVIVTPGIMSAMNSLFPRILERNDVVLMEEYSFPGTKWNVKICGAACIGVKVDQDGMVPDDLRKALVSYQKRAEEAGWDKARELKKPRVLYCVPAGHNPTGARLTLERKKEIYQIAQEHDILLIEDDPYYYLQYGSFVPSFQSIDVDGRVVRLDSLSKLVAPGLRFGWASGPDAIIRRMVEEQTTSAMSVSSLAEGCVSETMQHWDIEGFRRHIKHLQEEYMAMRDRVERAMEEEIGDLVEWSSPEVGIYIWVKMRNNADTLFLMDTKMCERHGVFAVPGADFACDVTKPIPYFRVCFSYTNKLEEGVKRLGGLLREQASSP